MDIYHWQGPEGVYREKRLIDLIGFSFMSIIKRKSIQGGIGKINFDTQLLKENLERLVTDLRKAKPATSKGVYLKKIILSSTMGPGLTVDQTSIAIG